MNKKNEIDGRHLPVMEEFYTLQGEGFNTGKAAYFIRIGGCDVGCHFCDVKEAWNASLLAPVDVEDVIVRIKPLPAQNAVITGGEPLLYDMEYFTRRLHEEGIKTFLETSGSSPFSGSWDWVCLSAKRNIEPLKENPVKADELKIIVCDESDFVFAEKYALQVRNECLLFLQPEWSRRNEMMNQIVEYIKQNPKWTISLQSHKYMRIP